MNKIKNLFATPRKAVITSICIVAALTLLGVGTVFAARTVIESNSIGKTAAQEAALSDAQITSDNATMIRTEFDHEDGQYVYDLGFYSDGIEYDYTIRASDGAVLKRDTDGESISAKETVQTTDKTTAAAKKSTQDTAASDDSTASTTTQTDTAISLDKAKKISITDAGVTSDEITYTKEELDYDDGVQVYDIEFYTATQGFDYKINASTGDIISKSAESITSDSQTAQTDQSKYIGVDKAKSIAAEQAQVAVSDAVFKKAKLENDDGYVVYDVEFVINGIEYEYKVDALTGSIVEYDSGYDD
ncbi:MAG: PepSY domain-containing protein [Lachnospiraceae bacterium]